MKDRELLEMAAKAAGYGFLQPAHNGDGAWVYLKDAIPNDDGEYRSFLWRPKTDDGDALRLAIKLGIRIDSKYRMEADDLGMVVSTEVAAVWIPKDVGEPSFHGFGGDNKAALVCKLIFLAAAEIGKAMP